MIELSAHLFSIAKYGIGYEAGHIRWNLALQTENSREVVCIDDKENQGECQHYYVSMFGTWLALKVIEGDAKSKDVENVNQTSHHRVKQLPVFAIL